MAPLLDFQKAFFSDYDHVAYPIKGNDACINMVANILPVDPLPRPWSGIKRSEFNFFRTRLCYISN